MGPNIIIAGAPKCGSTSLYHLLSQHPDIYFPVCKEPGYFIAEYFQSISTQSPNYSRFRSNLILDKVEYYRQYSAAHQHFRGDASITYLFKPRMAADKILRELGRDVHIIFILRNPLRRLVSQYQYCVELGFETEGLAQALKLESERMNSNWSSIFAYVGHGLYAEGVTVFRQKFPNVTVVFSENLLANTQDTLRYISHQIGLREFAFRINNNIYNKSGKPRIRLLHRLLMNKSTLRSAIYRCMKPWISREKAIQLLNRLRQMNQIRFNSQSQYEIAREWALDIYKDDLNLLASCIDVDIPWSEGRL